MLAQYRIWISTKPLHERYIHCRDMGDVARWFLATHKRDDEWGIENFDDTNNIWVDAFFSDDLISLCNALIR